MKKIFAAALVALTLFGVAAEADAQNYWVQGRPHRVYIQRYRRGWIVPRHYVIIARPPVDVIAPTVAPPYGFHYQVYWDPRIGQYVWVVVPN